MTDTAIPVRPDPPPGSDREGPTPAGWKTPGPALSQPEFIALMAMLIATVAFSIDAMLPALPAIAAELSPDAPNRAQLIVTSFVLGMGAGTLITGPLSDALGRKPVIMGFACIYIAGAALATVSEGLNAMLASRVLMGIGAAGPRVVALALVRDMYSGAAMARIMSFVMMTFTLAPAVAPSLGALVLTVANWHAIFWMLAAFSALSATWLAIRQPETLPRPLRRPFRTKSLIEGSKTVLGNPLVRRAIAVQTLLFGGFLGTISSIQPIFDRTFGRADSFPLWFAAIALGAAMSSALNAAIVERVGMLRVVTLAIGIEIGLTALYAASLLLSLPDPAAFGIFVAWLVTMFSLLGLTIGNINAVAMEPVGHVAGLAASIIGAVSTVLAVAIAAPLGLAFDGTTRPLAIGVLALLIASLAMTRTVSRIRPAA